MDALKKLLDLPRPGILTQEKTVEDQQIVQRLRPHAWEEYVGHAQQKKVVRRLLDAAKAREEQADHIMLSGSPGLGKTVMAGLILAELGSDERLYAGSENSVMATLRTIKGGEAFFVDELHAVAPLITEHIQIAMEGDSITDNRKRIPPFTLVGATTKLGKIPLPIRDRFGLTVHLDYYAEPEIAEIATRSAGKLDMELRPATAGEISARSRGVPRIANRLLRRIRDVSSSPTPRQAKETLLDLGIDSWGMESADRALLLLLHKRWDGGPVGLRTLAAAFGSEEKTLTDVFEPWLFRAGVLEVVARGRQLTERGHIYAREIAKRLEG